MVTTRVNSFPEGAWPMPLNDKHSHGSVAGPTPPRLLAVWTAREKSSTRRGGGPRHGPCAEADAKIAIICVIITSVTDGGMNAPRTKRLDICKVTVLGVKT